MAIAISAPYPNFFTPDGAPLEGGYVYIGVEGLNPIANPQPAYWDEALTIPAPAEVRVTGGYIVYNGAPARLYVAGDYSILVADKNGRTIYSRLYNTVYDKDLFLTEPRGTLSRSMRTPGSFNINLILDGGYYSWTNAGTSNYPTGCGAADLFALEVLPAPDGAGIIYQRLIDMSLTFNTSPYAWERKSIDAGATWSEWGFVGADNYIVSSPATPYTVIGLHKHTTILVTTGAGAFVCNLPAASGVVGNSVEIVKIDSAAGVIQIAPNGADVIANAGNVSIYIGQQFRHVTLQAQAAGQWIVTGGEWQPAQAVDTNGSHLSIGRLHLLPHSNTTVRGLLESLPAVGSWSAAIQISGLYGVPLNAKAVLLLFITRCAVTSDDQTTFEVAFSDNNSNVPASYTVHPRIKLSAFQRTTPGFQHISSEIIVPLNSSGQLYAHTIALTNCTTPQVLFSVRGYYMGD